MYHEKYMKCKTNFFSLLNQNGGDEKKEEKTLYERLGGVYAIAAVVNYFSDEILDDEVVGRKSENKALRDWSNDQSSARLPGLKFMRTLWVCEATGGPFKFSPTKPGGCPMSLEAAHKDFLISPEEFDVVANILERSLKQFNVQEKETNEVLSAFKAHKVDVTKGYFDNQGKPVDEKLICPHKI